MSLEKFKNRENLLSAEQMKRVSGGGTCGVMVEIAVSNERDAGTFIHVDCGISKADALSFRGLGGIYRWCCDSCYKTSYCGEQ